MASALIILTSAAFLSSLALLCLALADLALPTFKFWPPPKDEARKKSAFMALFRIMLYGLVSSSFLHLWISGFTASPLRAALGIVLLFLGFAVAFWATGMLGWKNAFGAKEGLRTDGVFAWSRNPIYVATWLGLGGWALLVPHPVIVATLFCWGLLYLIAVFLEERWLAQEYGADFQEFRRKVRRFI